MQSKLSSRIRGAVSRVAAVIIVVVLIILIVGGAAVFLLQKPATSTTTSSQVTTPSSASSSSSIQTSTTASSATSSSSVSTSINTTSSTSSIVSSTTSSLTSSSPTPTTLTYETTSTITYVDPGVSYDPYGSAIEGNVYERLLWFNGSSSTQLIPWLAQNYTSSPDSSTWNFTLRNGVTFADGETLNATSVYFSFYRMLIFDGSTPAGHGTQFAYDIQQFLNTSLASALCACRETYNAQYVNEVLAQNFIQITGPMSFTMHLMHPQAAFPYVLAGYNWGMIVAPMYVMQHDLAIWNQSSQGYTLPYPSLSGNLTTMIQQYFLDEVATCNSGITPSGCGTTYLDQSAQGSLAGSGPYTLQSVAPDSSLIVMKINPNYWGGPYQYMGGSKITPTFTTLQFKYVPSVSTREIDLQNAARSGQAMMIDVPSSNLYDVADRNAWLQNNTLVSIYPGVTILGPYPIIQTDYFQFGLNVTDPQTLSPYTFQPFADIRFRLAVADSVNMTLMNEEYNNNLGSVANSMIPPDLAPASVFNASLTPGFSYNLTAVQDLLLSAMEHPLTQFTLANGTAAPPGYYNNTFGCPTLDSNGVCSHPVPQTITMNYPAGYTTTEGIFNEIASVLNNISSTYNMGLSFQLQPLPLGQFFTELFSGYFYFNGDGGYGADYNYVLNFLSALFPPGAPGPAPLGWNLTVMGPLYQQALTASSTGNTTGLDRVTSLMMEIAAQHVMYMYTFFPDNFFVTTSNVQGLQFIAAMNSVYYFAVAT